MPSTRQQLVACVLARAHGVVTGRAGEGALATRARASTAGQRAGRTGARMAH